MYACAITQDLSPAGFLFLFVDRAVLWVSLLVGNHPTASEIKNITQCFEPKFIIEELFFRDLGPPDRPIKEAILLHKSPQIYLNFYSKLDTTPGTSLWHK